MFSIKLFRETLEASSGTRVEGIRRMMWYGQYKNWAQSAVGRFLSQEETDHTWSSWKAPGSKVITDKNRLRGVQRFAVKVSGEIHDYTDVSLKRALDQEQRLSKTISPEDLTKKIKVNVLGGHQSSCLADMASLKSQAALQGIRQSATYPF